MLEDRTISDEREESGRIIRKECGRPHRLLESKPAAEDTSSDRGVLHAQFGVDR